MTSREIVELTGKRHPDVRRDIRNMLVALEKGVSSFARTYKDDSGREIAELVEQRHDNVTRTIETLGAKGVITLPQSEEVRV